MNDYTELLEWLDSQGTTQSDVWNDFIGPRCSEAAAAIRELQKERDHWKNTAIWMGDCHAATLATDGMLKSTSKCRRERLSAIAHRCSEYLGHLDTPQLPVNRTTSDVINRLCSAVLEASGE